jgi:glycosyltransferase involved in cell wall biosynthesis
MLQAAADMGRRLTLLVVGRFLDEECRQAVEAIVQGHGLVPWKVTGTVPYRQVGGNLSAARIGLACYDVSLWRNQWGVPVKLLEYMSVGLPVLGNDFPLQRRLIYQSRSGRCVDVSDARGFAAAAVEMLDDPAGLAEMGRRGRRAVEEQYCWEVLQPRLLAAYKSLLT